MANTQNVRSISNIPLLVALLTLAIAVNLVRELLPENWTAFTIAYVIGTVLVDVVLFRYYLHRTTMLDFTGRLFAFNLPMITLLLIFYVLD